MIVYFDTSVLVAYYTVEDRTSDAAAIVERAELPVISDICIAELNVVIRRKQREGFLSPQAADAVLALFDEHVRASFVRIALDDGHLGETRRLPVAIEAPLRTLDALHLAVAADAGGAIATFDDRLADASRSVGIEVLS